VSNGHCWPPQKSQPKSGIIDCATVCTAMIWTRRAFAGPLLDRAFKSREALRSSDFAGGQSCQPNERRKLRRTGLRRTKSSRCSRFRILASGVMEFWSTGVLRPVRIAPRVRGGWRCFLGAGCAPLLRVSEFEDSDSTELIPAHSVRGHFCGFSLLGLGKGV
jgi:hypothetical protein